MKAIATQRALQCIEEVCVYFVEIHVGCRVVATYMPLNEAKILDQN